MSTLDNSLKELIIRRYRRILIALVRHPLLLLFAVMVDFDNYIPYGNLDTSPNPIAAVGRGLRDSLCFLHNNIPYAYSVPIPNPISDTIEDVWNGICDRPESPNTNRPATARGCQGTTYRVSATYTFFGEQKSFQQDFNGQVVNAYWRPIADTASLGINVVDVLFCDGGMSFFASADASSPDNYQRGQVSIAPLGTEGTVCCGNIPIPPIFNNLPPEITINLPGSGPVTFPVTFPGVTFDVNGDIIGFDPIIITPIGRFSFDLGGIQFSPRFNLNPNITIPIGGGGGQGGASESQVQQIVDQSQNTIINNLTQEIQGIDVDLTPILQAISGLEFLIDLAQLLEIVACYIRNGQGEVEASVLAGATPGGRFELPDGTFAVLVEATQPISGFTRTQSGAGASSQVVYWGWFSLNWVEAADGVRTPLQYLDQSMGVEPDMVSITVSPTHNNTARVTAFRQTEPCPVPTTLPFPIEQPSASTTQ